MKSFIIVAILILSQTAFAYYKVGFSTVDITPTQDHLDSGQIYLGGYGGLNSRKAEGVHDKLYARTIIIEHDDEKIVLVTVDLPGMGTKTVNKIIKKAKKVIPVDKHNLIVSSTHTHGGPDFIGAWGGVSTEYKNYFIDQVVKGIVDSHYNRLRANAYITTTSQNNVINRRGWDFNTQTITTLDFVSAIDGERLGTYVNVGCHPVVLPSKNRLITRDWLGYTVDTLEENLGAPVIISNGILGDMNPDVTEHTFRAAKEYGSSVAEGVIRSLDNKRKIKEDVQFHKISFNDKVSNISFMLGTQLGVLDYNFTGVFPYTTKLSVTYLHLGREVSIAFVPGETTTRMGHEILSYMGEKENFIVGLSDGAFGYLIKPDEYDSGRNHGYEEDVSLNSKVATHVNHQLMNAKKVVLDIEKMFDTLDSIGKN